METNYIFLGLRMLHSIFICSLALAFLWYKIAMNFEWKETQARRDVSFLHIFNISYQDYADEQEQAPIVILFVRIVWYWMLDVITNLYSLYLS
jgi:hypothetical protein